MSGDTYFTITEIAQQLDVGVSTVKVWSKRYAKWLPATVSNNEIIFPEKTLETFQLISECTVSGMEATAIEDILNDTLENIDSTIAEKNDTDLNTGGSVLGNLTGSSIDNILLQILDQQKKIASAQDRRATAEERKAFALESRAEAELLKANVMQEMLTVIKEQSVQHTVSSLMDKIQQMPGPSASELDFEFDKQLDELQELTETTSEETLPDASLKSESPEEPPIEEPSEVKEIEETVEPEPEVSDEEISPVQQEDIDDLSQLVEPQKVVEEFTVDDVDDLSLLIETEQPATPEDVDDLSVLIDGGDTAVADSIKDVDDLSALIDQPISQDSDDVDDLSLLISDIPAAQITEDVDDLSLLIDEQPEEQESDADDLSALIDISDSSSPEDSEDVDDLSLLIEDSTAHPVKEKPPEKKEPEDDHKSQVLSKIIKMKEKDGLSIEEATKKLNDEGIKTLSGKGEWDAKTITGIYKYIDSGKQKK